MNNTESAFTRFLLKLARPVHKECVQETFVTDGLLQASIKKYNYGTLVVLVATVVHPVSKDVCVFTSENIEVPTDTDFKKWVMSFMIEANYQFAA